MPRCLVSIFVMLAIQAVSTPAMAQADLPVTVIVTAKADNRPHKSNYLDGSPVEYLPNDVDCDVSVILAPQLARDWKIVDWRAYEIGSEKEHDVGVCLPSSCNVFGANERRFFIASMQAGRKYRLEYALRPISPYADREAARAMINQRPSSFRFSVMEYRANSPISDARYDERAKKQKLANQK